MQITIYCLINEFELKHPIYIVGENVDEYLESVSADDIGHTIAKYTYEKGIPNVTLGGASAHYLDRFVDDIYTVNALKYNANNEITVSIAENE